MNKTLVLLTVGLAMVAYATVVHADNIAPEATATASSWYAAEPPQYVADGRITYGAGQGDWCSLNVPAPHWVKLQWDSAKTFDEVKIYNLGYFSQDWSVYNTHSFQIQIPDGSGGWTDIHSVTGNTDGLYTYSAVTPVTADAMRLYITVPNSHATDTLARILEVEVNGVPEPATLSLMCAGGLAGLVRRRRR